MEDKGLKILINKYGCNMGSMKYVLPGSEIFRYVGQNVMYVHYQKKDDKWVNDYKPAEIVSINNFDPMTMTYDLKYMLDGETEIKEIKIIPEGYSWGNPEESLEMTRFVPFSIHTAMVEDECFFDRLEKLYDSRRSLSREEIETIARSKEKEVILKYSHNIGAVVKLDGGEMLWIRLHKISIAHKKGTTYNLKFEDNDKSWSFLVDFNDSEFDFNGFGKFKIIDLADPDTKVVEKEVVEAAKGDNPTTPVVPTVGYVATED